MDCAHCNRTMSGCASIKCSICASQYHLECANGEHQVPSTNSWRCLKCRPVETTLPNVINTIVHA